MYVCMYVCKSFGDLERVIFRANFRVHETTSGSHGFDTASTRHINSKFRPRLVQN